MTTDHPDAPSSVPQAQETENMTRQALLEARYELGVAASYADDHEAPSGLRTHARACAKTLVKIEAALKLLDAAAQPLASKAQPEPSIVERLIEEMQDWLNNDDTSLQGIQERVIAWSELLSAFLRDRSVRDGQAWQPIATAPMDGTELLLCEFRNGEFGHIEHGSWEFIERSDWDGARVYGWATDFGSIDEPTHWMLPLPKPTPSVPSGAQE